MARRRNRDSEPGWMISFADVVSLMLTFFVMLYAMSSLDRQKWARIAEALSRRADLPVEQAAETPQAQYSISTVFRKRLVNLDYLHAVLDEAMRTDPAFAPFRLRREQDQLLVALPAATAFAGDGLTAQAQRALFALGGLLTHVANPVNVVGHAGGGAPGAAAYPSGWEFAVSRAAVVANALREAGYTSPVQVLGRDRAGTAPAVEVVVQYGVRRR